MLLYLVWMFFSKKQLKIFNRQKVLNITLAEDEVLALQKTEVINNKTHDDHQVVSSMFFFFFVKLFIIAMLASAAIFSENFLQIKSTEAHT